MPDTLSSIGPTVLAESSESPPFGCVLRDGGMDAAWIRVTGELDIATAPRLSEVLGGAEEHGRRVVLDLRQLAFMDSAGVHVILDASQRATAAGGRFVVVRGPAQVDRVLELTGASARLQIVDLRPAEPPVQALLKLAQLEHGA